MTATPDSVAPDKDPVRVAGAIHLCLLLGRMLFHFWATTQRIPDSIACLAHYLGCKVEMLVSYDVLLLTVNDGASFRTRIDSSRGVAGLNLFELTRVSKLLLGLPQSQTNPNEIAGLCHGLSIAHAPAHPVRPGAGSHPDPMKGTIHESNQTHPSRKLDRPL